MILLVLGLCVDSVRLILCLISFFVSWFYMFLMILMCRFG